MYVKVRVTPGSKKERVTRKGDTEFDILVKEPAVRNLANNRICHILAETFDVQRNSVRVLTGHHSRSKIVSIDVL